jgi:hypothetical protein
MMLELIMAWSIVRVWRHFVIALFKGEIKLVGARKRCERLIECNWDERWASILSASPLMEAVDEGFVCRVYEFIEAYRPALEALANDAINDREYQEQE